MEWVEIVTLLVLVLLVVPLYRYLGAYTSLLVEHRRTLRRQDDTLEEQHTSLVAVAAVVEEEAHTLRTALERLDAVARQVDANAAELAALREGIGALGESFAAIYALVQVPDDGDPDP